jgi:plastocyanin
MTRKIALFAIAPALVWGLSGCGSSSTNPDASPRTTTTSSMSMPTTPSPTEPGGVSPSATAAAGETVISIADFKFTVPPSVAPGAQIIIENGDSQAHTVTSKTGGFDVKVDPDGTATLTAPKRPGNYPFVCSFHGNMTGTLVVK